MATGDRVDPYPGYNFRIEITGASEGVTAFEYDAGRHAA